MRHYLTGWTEKCRFGKQMLTYHKALQRCQRRPFPFRRVHTLISCMDLGNSPP